MRKIGDRFLRSSYTEPDSCSRDSPAVHHDGRVQRPLVEVVPVDVLDEAQQVALAVGKPTEARHKTAGEKDVGAGEARTEETHSSGQEVNCRWTTVRFRLWSRYCRLIMRSTCVGVAFCVVRPTVIGP